MNPEGRVHGVAITILLAMMTLGCPRPEPSELVILVSQTGELNYVAEDMTAGYDLALEDFNAENGTNIALKLCDTASSPLLAREALTNLAPEPDVVVGPEFSSLLANVQLYADDRNIALISPTSNAFTLAFDDTTFRLYPSNAFETIAAKALTQADYLPPKAIVLFMNESYGHEMLYLMRARYKADVLGFIPFESSLLGLSDSLQKVAAILEDQKKSIPLEDIFIYCIAFSELGDILHAASAYDALRQVQWVCMDGATAQPSIIASPESLAFARDTHLLGTAYSPDLLHPSESLTRVRETLMQRLGHEPISQAYYAYDSAQAALRTLICLPGLVSRNDLLGCIEGAFSGYEGVTGPMLMNSKGDRLNPFIALWQVRDDEGTPQWQRIGGVSFNAQGVPAVNMEVEPVL